MPADGLPAGGPDGRKYRASLLILLVVVFSNIAGFSLILPLLPFYGQELHASAFEVTVLFAAYSFGNIFGEIYWGRLSDRIGRKRVLAIAIGCAALSYVAFAFASVLWVAIAIRIVSGFFSGTMGVCQSYIADISRPEDRARSIGYFGASFNLGFALGPAIGGLLAAPDLGLAGFRLPILAAAAFAAVASGWAALVLKEAREVDTMRPLPDWSQGFRIVTRSALLSRLILIAFIGIGAFASMEAVFGLWTEANFGWNARQVGLTFIAVGLAGLTAQLLLIGPLARRFGEGRVIFLGLAVLAISMVLQPVLRAPIASVALMATLMAGHSLAFPSAGALISRSVGPDVQGSVNGLLMASNALSRIIAPPLFGAAFAELGMDWPYYMGALAVLLAMIACWQVIAIRDRQGAAEPIR